MAITDIRIIEHRHEDSTTRAALRWLALGFTLALLACNAKYPEGAIACSTASDCPAHWSCRAGAGAGMFCFSEPADDNTSSTSPSERTESNDAGPKDSGADTGVSGRGAAGSGGEPRAGAGGKPAADGGGGMPAADGGSEREEDAGPAEPPGCGDTETDRNHCGTCGQVCTFEHAEAACNSGSCIVSRCLEGFADCDGEAANGCETALDTGANCGACGLTCETDGDVIRACNAGSCGVLQLAVGEPEPVGPVNGSLGGGVYTHMCPPGEVITGLEIAVSQSVTYGFNAKCAPVSLTGTWEAPQIVVGASHLLPVPVGGFANSVIEQADCPENTVVTGTSGSLIIFAGETRHFIKTVLLACSRISRVTPSLVLVPDILVPGNNSPDPGDGSYSEMCGPGQVLTGFTGYAGAAIDALQAHCSSLSILASSSTTTP